jgi:hypothetical protein
MQRLHLPVLLLILASNAFAQNYKVSGSIPISGPGGWDYLNADSDARRLYVSHGGEVVVIDLDSKKPIGKLTGMGSIHGIIIAEDLNVGFVSDGGKNEVITFDPATLAIKGRIETVANPNSMAYDKSTGRLFVGHKPSKSMTVIKAATGEIEGRIQFDGVPEFPVSDGNGSVFVNIDDKSEIVRIDAKRMQVNDHWPLTPCEGPSGLAYDSQEKRLFAACSNKLMAVVNADTGKVVTTVPIGGRPDAATFDPGTRLAFSSNGDGTVTVVSSKVSDKYTVAQNVSTEVGARTMALDQKTHTLFLSDAKVGPPSSPLQRIFIRRHGLRSYPTLSTSSWLTRKTTDQQIQVADIPQSIERA